MEPKEWNGRVEKRPRMLTTVTALRQDRGLRAYEVSHRMGLTLHEYRNLEREPQKMTKNQQKQLAHFLEFDPDRFIFKGTEESDQGTTWTELFFALNFAIGLLLVATNAAAKFAFFFMNN